VEKTYEKESENDFLMFSRNMQMKKILDGHFNFETMNLLESS